MRRIVLDLDADTAREARRLIAMQWRAARGGACGDLLLAIDTALEGDRPQETGDVEYGVCVGGALIDTGANRSMADAWVNALRRYRAERAEFGEAAEPVQILVWPTDEAMDRAAADREPTDEQLANRPGMEGGIGYDMTPDTRDEHDPTL